jgi:diadenosine tetraphosphate (Ap4A) HIT family hydrolase
MDCLFCPPLLDASQVVLESTHCLFLQQPEPVLFGSGLIIPKRHCPTVFDLAPQEWQDTLALLQRVRTLLDCLHHPDGYNLGWNCGVTGGQHIFHAHLHVIPRYADEPFAGRGIRFWLKSEANRRKD